MAPGLLRYRVVTILIITALGWPAAAARAQDATDGRERPGTVFAGFSVIAAWNAAARQDPEGAGFYTPYYHGSLDWPALGTVLSGGVFVTRAFGLGAELMLRRPQSAIISEDSRAKFESWHLTPRYTDRERLISITNRWNLHAGSTDVQPVWGVTFSHTTQTMTERKGEYVWYGGTMPIERPDRSAHASRLGVVGGADAVFGRRHDVSVTFTGRLHWIPRTEHEARDRIAPAEGALVIYTGAGVTWRSHRR